MTYVNVSSHRTRYDEIRIEAGDTGLDLPTKNEDILYKEE